MASNSSKPLIRTSAVSSICLARKRTIEARCLSPAPTLRASIHHARRTLSVRGVANFRCKRRCNWVAVTGTLSSGNNVANAAKFSVVRALPDTQTTVPEWLNPLRLRQPKRRPVPRCDATGRSRLCLQSARQSRPAAFRSLVQGIAGRKPLRQITNGDVCITICSCADEIWLSSRSDSSPPILVIVSTPSVSRMLGTVSRSITASWSAVTTKT